MRLDVRACRCLFCGEAMILIIGEFMVAKGDVGLVLLRHMADEHPERFDMNPVRMALARRMKERVN